MKVSTVGYVAFGLEYGHFFAQSRGVHFCELAQVLYVLGARN